jgi:hypothetical protein
MSGWQSSGATGQRLVANNRGGYRRHSGLRTIRGGIIWGGRRWLAAPAQQRLLGYHRRKKSLVFRRKPSFFILPNMRRYSIVYKALRTITLLPIGRFPLGLSPKKTKGGLFGAAPAIPTHTGAITATGAAAPGPRMRPNLVGASAPARLTEPCAPPEISRTSLYGVHRTVGAESVWSERGVCSVPIGASGTNAFRRHYMHAKDLSASAAPSSRRTLAPVMPSEYGSEWPSGAGHRREPRGGERCTYRAGLVAKRPVWVE